MKLFSPAKINLFFRVLKKRPDGFHEIASLYQAISLGDELTIELIDGADRLLCDNPAIPTDSSNLILKAAELFRCKTGLKCHFRFTLQKHIPIEAGLGGGSSNAATTLWGLNQLLQTQLNIEELKQWGAELGSDVPFFFSSGRAYCEGRGERLTEEPAVSGPEFWIAKPPIGLPTPEVYRNLSLNTLEPRNPLEALHSHRGNAPDFFNDLEQSAFSLAPDLKKFKEALVNGGFDSVHMTGSGTAFYCLGQGLHTDLAHFFPARFHYRSGQDWYKFPR